VPEIRIGKTDSLSKRPDWKVGVENNNEDQKLIKKEWVRAWRKVEDNRVSDKKLLVARDNKRC